MFNDRYGLTQAVLEGRKTQTRRIAYTFGRLKGLTCRQDLEGVNKGRACLFDGGIGIPTLTSSSTISRLLPSQTHRAAYPS